MEFIHSIHARRASVGGSNIDIITPMPILPLSHIIITLDAQLTTANTSDNWLNLIGAMRSIQFRYRGTIIWGMSGLDLYRVVRALGLFSARAELSAQTANARRIVSLCIPFGRPLYDPVELFPGVNKGETELFISWTAVPTGYNTLLYSIESIQVVDAQPQRFLRATTISATPASTGDVDFDLPRATPLAAVGFVNTASEPGATLATAEQFKVLANNQDLMYSQVTNNAARSMQYYKYNPGMEYDAITHVENTAGAYTQNATTLTQAISNSLMSEFAWLPFDVLNDGQFALQAQNYQDLKLRVTFNTAAAIRILPVEIWTPDVIFRKGQGSPQLTRR